MDFIFNDDVEVGLKKLSIPKSENSISIDHGEENQVLKTNGSTIYWGDAINPTALTFLTTELPDDKTETQVTLCGALVRMTCIAELTLSKGLWVISGGFRVYGLDNTTSRVLICISDEKIESENHEGYYVWDPDYMIEDASIIEVSAAKDHNIILHMTTIKNITEETTFYLYGSSGETIERTADFGKLTAVGIKL